MIVIIIQADGIETIKRTQSMRKTEINNSRMYCKNVRISFHKTQVDWFYFVP